MSSGNVIGLTVLVNKRLANIIFGKRSQMYFKNFDSSIFLWRSRLTNALIL